MREEEGSAGLPEWEGLKAQYHAAGLLRPTQTIGPSTRPVVPVQKFKLGPVQEMKQAIAYACMHALNVPAQKFN